MMLLKKSPWISGMGLSVSNEGIPILMGAYSGGVMGSFPKVISGFSASGSRTAWAVAVACIHINMKAAASRSGSVFEER